MINVLVTWLHNNAPGSTKNKPFLTKKKKKKHICVHFVRFNGLVYDFFCSSVGVLDGSAWALLGL